MIDNSRVMLQKILDREENGFERCLLNIRIAELEEGFRRGSRRHFSDRVVSESELIFHLSIAAEKPQTFWIILEMKKKIFFRKKILF